MHNSPSNYALIPTPILASVGGFTVKLLTAVVVLSSVACGARDDLSTSPNQPPTAVIIAEDQGDSGLPLLFDASNSFDPEGDTLSYSWDFGDGAISQSEQQLHAFTAAGFYAVVLTVVDSEGDSDTDALRIEVIDNQPPVIVWNPSTVSTIGTAIIFDTSSSYDPDGTIASIDWDFGDSTAIQNGVQTSHTYVAEGTYTITVGVTDDRGSRVTDSAQIVIGPESLGDGYNGTWDWVGGDTGCSSSFESTLDISVVPPLISIVETTLIIFTTTYDGTITGTHFEVEEPSGGRISADFTSATTFEGTYSYDASSCTGSTGVTGTKR